MEIHELQVGRSGGVSLGNGFESHHTRVWKVKTDTVVGDVAVRSAVGVNLGDVYDTGLEFDNFSFCSSIECSCESETIWNVTATYSQWDPDYNQINPLDNKPRVSLEWQPEDVVIDVDLEGNPVVNKAGDPFDPSVMRSYNIGILRIQQNRAELDRSLIFDYQDAINLDTFCGFEPGTVRALPVGFHSDYANGTKFYPHNFQFMIDRRGWNRPIANVGLRELVDGQVQPIMLGGVAATSPVPLDEEGLAIPPPVDSSSIVQLPFKFYPETDMTSVFGFTSEIFD